MPRFALQIKIHAIYMRGGTSKGRFFRLQDLPGAAQQPGAVRDAILLRALSMDKLHHAMMGTAAVAAAIPGTLVKLAASGERSNG